MIEGEEFKPLEVLFEADGSSASFAVLDPSHPEGIRPKTLEDDYRDAELLAVSPNVPPAVRGYFDAARMLWVFGWVYYPFYTWAKLHAGLCAEMALKHRCRADKIRFTNKKGKEVPPTLEKMLDAALDRGWLTAEQFTRIRTRHARREEWVEMLEEIGFTVPQQAPETAETVRQLLRDQLHNFRQIRNLYAHPSGLRYMPCNGGYVALEFTRDLLNQLFPSGESGSPSQL